MDVKQIFFWVSKFLVLLVLYYIFFILGSMAVAGAIPDHTSQPGLVSTNAGMLIIGTANTLLIMALILSLRWRGWKLSLALAFAYYGAVTFLTQIETWFFLTEITVGKGLLIRLFIMGLPVAFGFIPMAVWIIGKKEKPETVYQAPALNMPLKQWVLKLSFIALAYVVLYWLAGYFVAWQNPELRAFYGSPGEIAPFLEHTMHTFNTNPGLFLFQILRGLLWTLCALPIILGSKLKVWPTAVLVGLFLSVPQNIAHILENPLMPLASIRLSHLIETATSTFIFGLLVVWLLHRKHDSIKDLFSAQKHEMEMTKSKILNKQFAKN